MAVESVSLPLVTLVLPGYNEAAVLTRNLDAIMVYLQTLADRYRFEVLVINDGSRDATGEVAEAAAKRYQNLRVIHHPSNFGLGQAFKTAFAASRGDYVVTMDADLSYAPRTIADLLEAITTRHAKLVLASAYMKGGSTTAVPFDRHLFSRVGNAVMGLMDQRRFSTYTCMVRAYDGPFIRALEPRSEGMGIMPEIIYKTLILGGRIVEIPAHLDWTLQMADAARDRAAGAAPKRQSSMRVLTHMLSTSVSSFLFRPFMMMLVPGVLLLIFSAYVNTWLMVDFFDALPRAHGQLAEAATLVYREHPATMLIGLLTLVLSVQLISLGAMSLQSKKYYEETYYQIVRLRRQIGGADARAPDESR
ncbi:MAG: glycosyltransferase family 2 protein [Lautropia sp.]